jgi:hypothetical protein
MRTRARTHTHTHTHTHVRTRAHRRRHRDINAKTLAMTLDVSRHSQSRVSTAGACQSTVSTPGACVPDKTCPFRRTCEPLAPPLVVLQQHVSSSTTSCSCSCSSFSSRRGALLVATLICHHAPVDSHLPYLRQYLTFVPVKQVK